eukprot:m.176051 g.176051  ORF g.176051 m.176051 type:complete len:201 (-) comp14101_c0_seq1:116-718(-)
MGCGITKLKKEHEEEMGLMKQSHEAEVAQLKEQYETAMQKKIEEMDNEKKETVSKWTSKWQDSVKKAMESKRAVEKAEEDARIMRLKAISRDELQDKVATLTKEKRRLEAKIADLQEEMHHKKLIYEGQKDILKKQQYEKEQEALKEQRRLSIFYNEEKQQMLKRQEQLEIEKEKTATLLRAQTENALALQAGKPNGTSF